MNLNKVILLGRLTADPELKNLASGQTLVDLRLAVNRRYRKDHETVEDTCFVTVTAWNKTAEFVAKFFCKGRAIFVEGRLKHERWESEHGPRSRLKVVAENIQFVPDGKIHGTRIPVGVS